MGRFPGSGVCRGGQGPGAQPAGQRSDGPLPGARPASLGGRSRRRRRRRARRPCGGQPAGFRGHARAGPHRRPHGRPGVRRLRPVAPGRGRHHSPALQRAEAAPRGSRPRRRRLVYHPDAAGRGKPAVRGHPGPRAGGCRRQGAAQPVPAGGEEPDVDQNQALAPGGLPGRGVRPAAPRTGATGGPPGWRRRRRRSAALRREGRVRLRCSWKRSTAASDPGPRPPFSACGRAPASNTPSPTSRSRCNSSSGPTPAISATPRSRAWPRTVWRSLHKSIRPKRDGGSDLARKSPWRNIGTRSGGSESSPPVRSRLDCRACRSAAVKLGVLMVVGWDCS